MKSSFFLGFFSYYYRAVVHPEYLCVFWLCIPTCHLKILTAASVSSSVLRKTFKVNFSLMRHPNSSQFICLLLKLGYFSWFNACDVSAENDGKIGLNMIATAKSWRILLYKKKKKKRGRSWRLFVNVPGPWEGPVSCSRSYLAGCIVAKEFAETVFPLSLRFSALQCSLMT